MDPVLDARAGPRITTIVLRMLEKRGGPSAIAPSQKLREAGLTSLDMVNLMLAVEGEFDIFIPQAQMSPENFSSIEAITTLVSSLTPAP